MALRSSSLAALFISTALFCACEQGSGTSSGGAGSSTSSGDGGGSGGEGGGDLFPPPPEGSFSCGDQTCSFATDYCRENGPGPKGDPTYVCLPLPSECLGSPQCSTCFDMTIENCGAGVGQSCADKPDGSIVLTCIYK